MIAGLDGDVGIMNQNPAIPTEHVETFFQCRPLVELRLASVERIRLMAVDLQSLRGKLTTQFNRLFIFRRSHDDDAAPEELIPRKSQGQEICVLDANGNGVD
jgi:hypothetical protein